MAGCLAVHEADPTDDSEFAGVLGNVLERNADQALRTIVDLRSTKGKKSPLTVAELRAMAVTCKNAVDFDTDDGTLAFVRLFANEADAYFREVQESA
jgi:hypothetical protein